MNQSSTVPAGAGDLAERRGLASRKMQNLASIPNEEPASGRWDFCECIVLVGRKKECVAIFASPFLGIDGNFPLTKLKTTIDIPEKLLADAMRFTGAKTKREAVVKAVESFNRRQRLSGSSLPIDAPCWHKAARLGRAACSLGKQLVWLSSHTGRFREYRSKALDFGTSDR